MIRIEATIPGMRWLKVYQKLIPEMAKDIGRITMLKVPTTFVGSGCAKETIERAMNDIRNKKNFLDTSKVSIVQLVNRQMSEFLPREENVKYNPVYVQDMPFDMTTNTGEMWLVNIDTLCPEHVIHIQGHRDEQKFWIPVDVKLPKEHENVLVTVAGGEEEDDWVKISWLSNTYHGIWEFDPTLEVIAWRPLPEPYKESEEE